MIDDINWDLAKLSARGYCCSQILIARGLELAGEESSLMVRSAKALCGGLMSGLTCGALSGGACLIMMLKEPDAGEIIPALNRWFRERYGSSECAVLTKGGDPGTKAALCPGLVSAVYEKCLALLEEYGFEG